MDHARSAFRCPACAASALSGSFRSARGTDARHRFVVSSQPCSELVGHIGLEPITNGLRAVMGRSESYRTATNQRVQRIAQHASIPFDTPQCECLGNNWETIDAKRVSRPSSRTSSSCAMRSPHSSTSATSVELRVVRSLRGYRGAMRRRRDAKARITPPLDVDVRFGSILLKNSKFESDEISAEIHSQPECHALLVYAST